jgi:hypothetical protein
MVTRFYCRIANDPTSAQENLFLELGLRFSP